MTMPRLEELSPIQRHLLAIAAAIGRDPLTGLRCRGRARVTGSVTTAEIKTALDKVILAADGPGIELVELSGLKMPMYRRCPAAPVVMTRKIDAAADAPAEIDALSATLGRSCRHVDSSGAVPGSSAAGQPLYGLVRVSAEEHVLLFDIPSMAADAFCLKLICDRLAAFLFPTKDCIPAGADLVTYEEVGDWLNDLRRGAQAEDGDLFWRQAWGGRTAQTLSQARVPAETGTGTIGEDRSMISLPLELAASATRQLLQVVTEDEQSLRVCLLAAWGWILARASGSETQLVGVATSLRRIEGIAGVLGPCRTVVPVDVALSPKTSFRDQLPAIARSLETAEIWQPLFRWPDPGGAPPGPACLPCLPFVLEDASETFRPSSTVVQLVEAADDADLCALRLRLLTADPSGLRLSLDYDPARFSAQLAASLGRQVVHWLAAVADAPNAPLDSLPPCMVKDAQRDGTLVVPQPRSPEVRTFHAAFRDQVRRTPDRIAVSQGAQTMSYRELDRLSARIARRLVGLGSGRGVPIGLCVPRGIDAISAILGIMRSGGAYVPVSPDNPPERIAAILNGSRAPVVVTSREATPSLSAFDGVRCLLEDHSEEGAGDLPDTADADTLAYIIHTSGTTGSPKGVMIEHGALLTLATALDELLAAERPDRPWKVSLNAPLEFDASLQQLCFLLRGDEVVIIDAPTRLDPTVFVRTVEQAAIDVVDATPSHLRQLLDAGLCTGESGMPRYLLVAGEAMDSELWMRLARLPQTAAYNIYGPTEATVDATAIRIDGDEVPSIGRPLAGYGIYLLDDARRPVPAGVPGEIHISGRAVARGYLGQSEETERRFPPDPFEGPTGGRMYATGDRAVSLGDGRFAFLGRTDDEFKLRGVRIAPGEIEAALERHPAVSRAVAVLTCPERGEPAISAHLSTSSGQTAPERRELRRFLATHLPEAMIPAHFHLHDALPMLPNGKIDRARLATIEGRMPRSDKGPSPRTEIEKVIACTWQELLSIESVGLDSNFMELGGHSLMLVQVQHWLSERLRRTVPLATLILHGTIRELAAALDEVPPAPEAEEAGRDRALIRRRLAGARRCTARQHQAEGG
jgi:amino acid adenylation domain-containing protein